MFEAAVYVERRKKLVHEIQSGLLVFLGNQDSPMNYADNCYRFTQDSCFLYYWGLNTPGLAAIIDVDAGKETLFGPELTVDDIVWSGPQATLAEKSARVGVAEAHPCPDLAEVIRGAAQEGRGIHFLPQYRSDNMILLADLLSMAPAGLNNAASVDFIKAVVRQRSVKSELEIAQIETALEITCEMHTYAMKHARPGVVEREIAGVMEGMAYARAGALAYPIIFSVNGHTLHNHNHDNVMQAGQIAVNDCGASSAMGYAGDITRTIPISGKFTTEQKEIYQIVLEALDSSIPTVRPNVKFRDVHLHASKVLAEGLHALGLMQGDVDEAVAAGAHALFFPHGLGHMLGLDVHDMENLGEDYVGYDDETKRSDQFGLAYLRLGRRVQQGFVLTVEPGIYFIPELIDLWQADKKHAKFINYDRVQAYRTFGGIRIEENLVVTSTGQRILGKPVPKTVQEVEDMAAS
ncbi:MAG: aminopeptidase P family protein [bacterium]